MSLRSLLRKRFAKPGRPLIPRLLLVKNFVRARRRRQAIRSRPVSTHDTASGMRSERYLGGILWSVRSVSRWADIGARRRGGFTPVRSEEHTSELQSLMRISYA